MIAKAFVPTAGNQASLYLPDEDTYVDVKVIGIARTRDTAMVQHADGTKQRVHLKELDVPMNPDVNERFDHFRSLADLVLDKSIKSLFVTGEGGIGKSHTINELMEFNGFEEEKDFIRIRGHCTPYALFQSLQEHATKVFVFDDCDSVLKDGTSLNIMKAVLDTYQRRIVKWLSTKGAGMRSFEFKGSVVFLSNLNKDNVDGAILSRSIIVDLYMTPAEKIQRMEHIIGDLDCVSLQPEERLEVLAMVDKYKNTVSNLNLRSLIKALVVYEKTRNMNIVKYQILNS